MIMVSISASGVVLDMGQGTLEEIAHGQYMIMRFLHACIYVLSI
jgi:hypothetical protein